MINYLVSAKHSYTVTNYVRSWAQELGSTIRILPYEELARHSHLAGGTYIFSDLERLTPAQRVLAASVWDQLATLKEEVRLLNHPLKATRRHELLRTLHENRQNNFKAFRPKDRKLPHRFPVFLRLENEHAGSMTSLIPNQEALDWALIQVAMMGVDLANLLIVEFCDTSDENNVFRKYGAFRMGDRLLPRHLIFSKNWMLKENSLADPTLLAEELQYLQGDSHNDWLKKIFDMARIDYGRIDYSFFQGKIQVWEINTNPIVMWPREKFKPEELPNQEYFAPLVESAWKSLDHPTSPDVKIPLTLTRNFLEIIA